MCFFMVKCCKYIDHSGNIKIMFFPIWDALIIEETLQELRMLSSVTLNCEVTKVVKSSGSQLSEL